MCNGHICPCDKPTFTTENAGYFVPLTASGTGPISFTTVKPSGLLFNELLQLDGILSCILGQSEEIEDVSSRLSDREYGESKNQDCGDNGTQNLLNVIRDLQAKAHRINGKLADAIETFRKCL